MLVSSNIALDFWGVGGGGKWFILIYSLGKSSLFGNGQ